MSAFDGLTCELTMHVREERDGDGKLRAELFQVQFKQWGVPIDFRFGSDEPPLNNSPLDELTCICELKPVRETE